MRMENRELKWDNMLAGIAAQPDYLRGRAAEAHRVIGGVSIIVIGEDGDVDIRRLQQAQMDLVVSGAGGERMHEDQGTGAGGAGKESAAGKMRAEIGAVFAKGLHRLVRRRPGAFLTRTPKPSCSA